MAGNNSTVNNHHQHKKKEIISEKTEGYTWNLHVMKMKTVVRNNSSLEMAAL
jgi:hypothetical protein